MKSVCDLLECKKKTFTTAYHPHATNLVKNFKKYLVKAYSPKTLGMGMGKECRCMYNVTDDEVQSRMLHPWQKNRYFLVNDVLALGGAENAKNIDASLQTILIDIGDPNLCHLTFS
uniref:Uncharacterized protein n=1 Tax=Romanomermis culicivorax TaxID=13658 RepID=A0A915J0I6_ROMCU